MMLWGAFRYLSSITRASLSTTGIVFVSLEFALRPLQVLQIKSTSIGIRHFYDIISYFRASRSCRVHCRKLKTVPVVHRHVLVSYINVPSIMVRLERYLKASQSIISLSLIFFGTPCKFDRGQLCKPISWPSYQCTVSRRRLIHRSVIRKLK